MTSNADAEPDRVNQLVKVVSGIASALALLTALLYYFGWVRSQAQSRAFGTEVSLRHVLPRVGDPQRRRPLHAAARHVPTSGARDLAASPAADHRRRPPPSSARGEGCADAIKSDVATSLGPAIIITRDRLDESETGLNETRLDVDGKVIPYRYDGAYLLQRSGGSYFFLTGNWAEGQGRLIALPEQSGVRPE